MTEYFEFCFILYPNDPQFKILKQEEMYQFMYYLIFHWWSTEWVSRQLEYLQDQDANVTHKIEFFLFFSTLTHKNNGSAWTSQPIRVIWSHCHTTWLEHNLASSGVDAEHHKAIALAQAKEKIRALYALCPLCRLHCHRNRFHVSPEAHFAI
jgi:hypothetical protein